MRPGDWLAMHDAVFFGLGVVGARLWQWRFPKKSAQTWCAECGKSLGFYAHYCRQCLPPAEPDLHAAYLAEQQPAEDRQ